MTTHLINGDFQSDKYPTCPLGKVPLSTKDPIAQPHLWAFASGYRSIDPGFSDDVQQALLNQGFVPPEKACGLCGTLPNLIMHHEEYDVGCTWSVECESCGNKTEEFNLEIDAIKAWHTPPEAA